MNLIKRDQPLAGRAGIFERRLERLVRLSREYVEELNPAGTLLLERCITATYLDLCDTGHQDIADRLTR